MERWCLRWRRRGVGWWDERVVVGYSSLRRLRGRMTGENG